MTQDAALAIKTFLPGRYQQLLKEYETPNSRIVKLFDIDVLSKSSELNGIENIENATRFFPLPTEALEDLKTLVLEHKDFFQNLIQKDKDGLGASTWTLDDLDQTKEFSAWWNRYSNQALLFMGQRNWHENDTNLQYFLSTMQLKSDPVSNAAFVNAYIGALSQLCARYLTNQLPEEDMAINTCILRLFAMLGKQARVGSDLTTINHPQISDLIAAPLPIENVAYYNVKNYINDNCRTLEYGVFIEQLRRTNIEGVPSNVLYWWGEEIYKLIEFMHVVLKLDIEDRELIKVYVEEFVSNILEMIPQQKLLRPEMQRIKTQLLERINNPDSKEMITLRTTQTTQLLTGKLTYINTNGKIDDATQKHCADALTTCLNQVTTYSANTKSNHIDGCLLRAKVNSTLTEIDNATPYWEKIINYIKQSLSNIFSLAKEAPALNDKQTLANVFSQRPPSMRMQ